MFSFDTEENSLDKLADITLCEYLFNYSFYMFNWHLYYEGKYGDLEENVDDLISKNIHLNDSYILTLDQFNQKFTTNEQLKKYQCETYHQLSMRYAKAESAKGRFYYNEKSNFIITDINWFENIFDILSSGNFTAEQKNNQIFGQNVGLSESEKLKERLKNFCKNYQTFENLFKFLIETNIILITDENVLVPLFLLNEEYSDRFVRL